MSLTPVILYQGTHGDFGWYTGPKTRTDDFYSGSSTVTETALRDVAYVGVPVVGQELCRNGRSTHKYCQDVRKLNVCQGINCNLVEMDVHTSTGGDSGGPWYWSNIAYGVHHGYVYDPWPFDREVFSRADRIDNALGVSIATS